MNSIKWNIISQMLEVNFDNLQKEPITLPETVNDKDVLAAIDTIQKHAQGMVDAYTNSVDKEVIQQQLDSLNMKIAEDQATAAEYQKLLDDGNGLVAESPIEGVEEVK